MRTKEQCVANRVQGSAVTVEVTPFTPSLESDPFRAMAQENRARSLCLDAPVTKGMGHLQAKGAGTKIQPMPDQARPPHLTGHPRHRSGQRCSPGDDVDISPKWMLKELATNAHRAGKRFVFKNSGQAQNQVDTVHAENTHSIDAGMGMSVRCAGRRRG